MEQVYIPQERIRVIRSDEKALPTIMRLTGCKIGISKEDNSLSIEGGDAFCEFLAKNMLTAIGRGFDVETALLLKNDDYYFSYIDLRQLFRSEKRILQVKARIIGKGGKAKRYIETLTSAHLSVYGHTVGFIGKHSDVVEAETAVRTIIEGSTHRLAYSRMEARHRKNRESV